MLVSVANPPPLYDPQTNATPSTNDRRVAKADLLRREMSWSSDDALTPAPRTYACGRDFYYDDESDVETPVARHVPPGSSARVARQNGRTGRDAGLTGSQAQRDVGVDGNGNRVRARGTVTRRPAPLRTVVTCPRVRCCARKATKRALVLRFRNRSNSRSRRIYVPRKSTSTSPRLRESGVVTWTRDRGRVPRASRPRWSGSPKALNLVIHSATYV
jgi:hypothetical protein